MARRYQAALAQRGAGGEVARADVVLDPVVDVLDGAQRADVAFDVPPRGRGQRRLERGHQIGVHQAPPGDADAANAAGIPTGVVEDLRETLDGRVGVVLVRMGELAQHAHVRNPAAQPRVFIALRAAEENRGAFPAQENADRLEVHGKIRQPAGVCRAVRRSVVGVGDQ